MNWVWVVTVKTDSMYSRGFMVGGGNTLLMQAASVFSSGVMLASMRNLRASGVKGAMVKRSGREKGKRELAGCDIEMFCCECNHLLTQMLFDLKRGEL